MIHQSVTGVSLLFKWIDEDYKNEDGRIDRIMLLEGTNLEVYGIIYKIVNKINNKIYIGQTTKDFNVRYRQGKWWKYTHSEYLKNSVKKYGLKNFEVYKHFDIAFSKTELDIKEDMYIKYYKTMEYEYGYNKKEGGSNGKPNYASRMKNSKSQLGFSILQYKDKIINMYVDEKMSTVDIGRVLGVSKRCINSNLKRWKVNIRGAGETLSFNQTGDKRYNALYIIVRNVKGDIIKYFGSQSECGRWLVEIGYVNNEKGGIKAILTNANTGKIYKGFIFEKITKNEFLKLNIHECDLNKNITINENEKLHINNTVIVEVYNKEKELLETFYASKDCAKWLLNNGTTNTIRAGQHAIDRNSNTNKIYKNKYIFKKYSKEEYLKRIA